ncbi:hypothetical protein [Streptomyces paradoxus]
MPEVNKGDVDKPKEARWRKIRLIASVVAALSAAAFQCGRLLIWLRNLL